MKAAVTLLFSLLLMLNPPVLTGALMACKSAGPCACSHCDTSKCCVKRGIPAPPLAPAAPARVVQESLQLLAVSVTRLVVPPSRCTTEFPVHSASPLKTAGVPLYEWNCSYLI